MGAKYFVNGVEVPRSTFYDNKKRFPDKTFKVEGGRKTRKITRKSIKGKQTDIKETLLDEIAKSSPEVSEVESLQYALDLITSDVNYSKLINAVRRILVGAKRNADILTCEREIISFIQSKADERGAKN